MIYIVSSMENSTNGFRFLSLNVTASQYALALSSTESELGLDILITLRLVGKLFDS